MVTRLFRPLLADSGEEMTARALVVCVAWRLDTLSPQVLIMGETGLEPVTSSV